MSNLILLTVSTCIFEYVVLPEYVTCDNSQLLIRTAYPVSRLVVTVQLLDTVFLFPGRVPEAACGDIPYLYTMDASRQTNTYYEK
jgi:hypothetical protein